MKTNITYIVSNIDKALAFEWIASHLNRDRFNLSFVLLNSADSELEKYLKSINIRVKRIEYNSKLDLLKAIINLICFFIKNKTNVVHCHLFDASLAGLLAAKLCLIKKRIYTRHHSDYHHKYFPRAVYYDKFINFLATDIVSISKVVSTVLVDLEKADLKKVNLIHHGFDLDIFSESDSVEMKIKYKTNGNYPVIGVVARYTDWKGIQYIIPAFKQILEIYPNAKLVLANAKGDFEFEIKQLLSQLPNDSYVEIVFEPQIFLLYQIFDIYVHTPIDSEVEAFGQTYVEALVSGIPSVFTLSGVANEFIEHEKNAVVVDYKNSEDIKNAMIMLVQNEELRNELIRNGKQDVQQFNIVNFIYKLESLYL